MSNSRKFAGDVAAEIQKTFTERGQVYGPPEVNFANIAAFWNAWIGARYPEANVKLDGIDVGQMSALIKKARMANTPDHRDSALDDATYTLLGAGIAAPVAVENAPQSDLDKALAAFRNAATTIHVDGVKIRGGIVPGHPNYRSASPFPPHKMLKVAGGDAGNY